MDKKTLQEWHDDKQISYSQKRAIENFGILDNCLTYTLNDFKKVYFWKEKLKKIKDNTFVKGKIKMMIFFSTWWNNNLVILISENEKTNDYWTSLIIYEAPLDRGRKEILEVKLFNASDNHKWEETEKKAREVEKILKSDNPILYSGSALCFWKENNYNFSEVVEQEFPLPLYSYSLGEYSHDYIKPLDIVKIYIKFRDGEGEVINMLHSAIYLGKGMVCHARPHRRNNSKTNSYNSYGGIYYDFEEHYGRQGNEEGWIEITSLKNFLRFLDNFVSKSYKLVRLHSTIPYKKNNLVIKHIAKLLDNSSYYYFDRGKFSIKTNNCEHFVNLVKYGVDFSEGMEIKNSWEGTNNEFEFRNLEEEWKKGFTGKDDSLLDRVVKRDYFDPQIVKQIEGYINYYDFYYHITTNRETEMDARIEAIPPSGYRIGN